MKPLESEWLPESVVSIPVKQAVRRCSPCDARRAQRRGGHGGGGRTALCRVSGGGTAALAACVVLGAFGVLLFRGRGVALTRVPPIAVVEISPAIVRSNSGVYAVMKTPVGEGAVHLRFALPEKGLSAPRAVLGTPERPGVWSGPVAFDDPPAAHVEVNAALLARGDYLLSVSTAAGYVASYVFRVD